MKLRIIDLIRLILPAGKTKKFNLENIEPFFNKKNYKILKKLLKMKKVGISYANFGTSQNFLSFSNYPIINSANDDKEIVEFVDESNKSINEKIKVEYYKKFSVFADQKIVSLIAPNIRGMENIKLACAIQLFANEKSHILLLGDPGTGKTDILRSCSELHPISSFGLGSGTSGAGLGVSFKGDEMIKGLLPLADKGLCCIDELNLLKNEDRASLYNAMEKGFITYDKASKHVKVDADISILATANPKGDKFAGWMIETLKKQLPFESALLSRFHLMFLIRKPDMTEFLEIAKHILKGTKKKEFEANKRFVREYIDYARQIEVKLPSDFEKEITDFIKELKDNESDYLVEISPRLVIGFVRLVKASARMNLRKYVTSIDLMRVKKIFLNSLEIKKEKKN